MNNIYNTPSDTLCVSATPLSENFIFFKEGNNLFHILHYEKNNNDIKFSARLCM